jgi:hypothetical protein
MDQQKARMRVAAFAGSDREIHANKHGFEARRRRVMPQQNGTFHLRTRLRERSRGS